MPEENCNPDKNLVQPIINYAHGAEDGRSITGGYVYRGSSLSSLTGNYIYGDFVSGRIWKAQVDPNGIKGWRTEVLRDTGVNLSTFGVDSKNELYVAAFSGEIYKFVKE